MSFANWSVSGSYFEVCNCEAICPCRRQGERPGGVSSHGVCEFALSWWVKEGYADTLDLSGLAVVMVGRWYDHDSEAPWRVSLYVDERGGRHEQEALAHIFLGRAGGQTLSNYAALIGEVYGVHSAAIELDHTPGQERMAVAGRLSANTAHPVLADVAISCGIPGHDHPGTEVVSETCRLVDPPLAWEWFGRCGFATTFSYHEEV